MDFWDHHGIMFLLGLTFFPRITTLFFMVTPFGFFAWLGWLFAPHILVAVYASVIYWDQNPFLVIMSWIIALIGTYIEEDFLSSRSR